MNSPTAGPPGPASVSPPPTSPPSSLVKLSPKSPRRYTGDHLRTSHPEVYAGILRAVAEGWNSYTISRAYRCDRRTLTAIISAESEAINALRSKTNASIRLAHSDLVSAVGERVASGKMKTPDIISALRVTKEMVERMDDVPAAAPAASGPRPTPEYIAEYLATLRSAKDLGVALDVPSIVSAPQPVGDQAPVVGAVVSDVEVDSPKPAVVSRRAKQGGGGGLDAQPGGEGSMDTLPTFLPGKE